MNIVPMPWHLVESGAVILGRNGQPVQLGAVQAYYNAERSWVTAEWNGQTLERDPDDVVPVVLADMDRALGVLFRAFPLAQILQITDER